MPRASLPARLRKIPARPRAKARVRDQSTPANPVAAGLPRSRRVLLEGEVAVVAEPGVEVDPPPEGAEAVVGDHQEGGLAVVDALHDPAHQVVHVPVHRRQDVREVGQAAALVGGMPRVQGAEEHVLHPVGPVEDADQQALAGAVQAVEEHPLALLVEGARLLQEGLLVEDPGVEGLRVLGEAEGAVLAEAAAQVGGVRGRVGQGQAGPVGIDLDRREVELQRLGRGQQEAADAAHADPGAAAEGQLHPRGVHALAQVEPAAGGR